MIAPSIFAQLNSTFTMPVLLSSHKPEHFLKITCIWLIENTVLKMKIHSESLTFSSDIHVQL